MASQRQITANQQNAQKSTGPTTADGKAVSSRNALKTGIDAKSLIIRHEDPLQLEALSAEYFNCFTPARPEERYLVDTLISSEWLRRRCLRVKAEHLRSEESPLGTVFSPPHDNLARVKRRLNSAQRDYASALKQLQAIRARQPGLGPVAVPVRHPNHAPPTAPAVTETIDGAATETVNPKLGQFLISGKSVRPKPFPWRQRLFSSANKSGALGQAA